MVSLVIGMPSHISYSFMITLNFTPFLEKGIYILIFQFLY
jgi:hypothetical protein